MLFLVSKMGSAADPTQFSVTVFPWEDKHVVVLADPSFAKNEDRCPGIWVRLTPGCPDF